ncbi:MAG: DNA-processing protein DprA [Eubacteriales bacterium]|nr:DNA-processing protein DprA [Eubacteriales bacterium]MDY3332659.1 DNA-processing protein DprA [Gallibacter sp.]
MTKNNNSKFNEQYIKIEMDNPKYPIELLALKNPPKQLHCIGNVDLLYGHKFAIVGSRKFSTYGRRITRDMSNFLSKSGITIISGLAMGIDAIAHENSVENIGSTIAVLGCGLDSIYPSSNKNIRKKIEEYGLVITEYDFGTKPSKWTFPQRNRIIAALSEKIIVTEAGNNSGACITAELGVELGKEVYTFAHNIYSQHGIGSNKLIKDGITPLFSIDEILKDYTMVNFSQINHIETASSKISDEELAILNYIQLNGETTCDSISQKLNISIDKVSSITTILELKGLIENYLGRIFAIK